MEQDGVHLLLPLGGRRLGRSGSMRSSSAAMSLGIGPQGVEPVDDEAAEPGVGTVPQQGPDLLGLPHADQGDRRPACRSASRSLTSSESVSFSSGSAFLSISAWNKGKVFAACRSATGKRAAYAFGSASISRSASRSGIVAGVVGEDVVASSCSLSDRSLSRKIAASGAVSLLRTGAGLRARGRESPEFLTDTSARSTLPALRLSHVWRHPGS